jgi:hypothetical protein
VNDFALSAVAFSVASEEMSANTKETRIRRISGAPGKGVGSNTGVGTGDIVVPDFPELPDSVTPESAKEFNGEVSRWKASVQGQLPVPRQHSAPQPTTVERVIERVIEPNGDIESLDSRVSALESRSVYGLTAADVAEIVSQSRYTHKQSVPKADWIIPHNLNAYPSVAIVDSAGTVVGGDVTYQSPFQVSVRFAFPFSGKAYLIS